MKTTKTTQTTKTGNGRGGVARSAKATTDHGEIRRWVEEHGGRPVQVKGGRGGAMRINVVAAPGVKASDAISWDEFFRAFDDGKLAFVYQAGAKAAGPSRFGKIVTRDATPEIARAAPMRDARGRIVGNGARGVAASVGRPKVGRPRIGQGTGVTSNAAAGSSNTGARGRRTKADASSVGAGAPSAIDVLKNQHRTVREIFARLQAAPKRSRRRPFDELVVAFAIHFDLEERCFYPSVKKRSTTEMLLEAAEEHLSVKRVLADLIDLDPADARWPAKTEVLRILFEQHVAEEETKIFAQARSILGESDLRKIGGQLMAMDRQLRGAPAELPRHVTQHTHEAAPI